MLCLKGGERLEETDGGMDGMDGFKDIKTKGTIRAVTDGFNVDLVWIARLPSYYQRAFYMHKRLQCALFHRDGYMCLDSIAFGAPYVVTLASSSRYELLSL